MSGGPSVGGPYRYGRSLEGFLLRRNILPESRSLPGTSSTRVNSGATQTASSILCIGFFPHIDVRGLEHAGGLLARHRQLGEQPAPTFETSAHLQASRFSSPGVFFARRVGECEWSMSEAKPRTVHPSPTTPHKRRPSPISDGSPHNERGYSKKFYLKKHLSNQRVKEILRSIRVFGTGNAEIEHFRGEIILYVKDLGDAEIVKSEYRDLIDAEADVQCAFRKGAWRAHNS